MAPHYSPPPIHRGRHSFVVTEPESELPLKVVGAPFSSDLTLFLETATPYDSYMVWPGLSASPRKACR